MIINVRGTHGSGKSTLVRTVIDTYQKAKPVFMTGRKNPIGYVLRHPRCRPVFVLGHYETPTGGCDNVPNVELMFKYVRKYHAKNYHVLFEGILAQHSVPRLMALHEDGLPVRVAVLEIPVTRSIRSVKKRRRARGDTRPFDPSNVLKEHASVQRATLRLRDAGLRVRVFALRRRALDYVLRVLGP